MKKVSWKAALVLALGALSLRFSGCADNADNAVATAEDGGSTPSDSAAGAITVTLSETAFTLATPDLGHMLSATVAGTAVTSVTWSSSDTYIATVDAAGLVKSVSGGQADITATSTVDTTKKASATVTVAEPNRPRASSYLDAKSVTSGRVNILMVGDSLMRTYVPSPSDQTGWGQVLSQFFSSDVTVDNTLSNGGRSSRSFYNEVGRWDQIKARLRAAAGTPTFVFIMFAHNDQKKITDTMGADFLTFARTNPNGTVAGTYYDYLERYIVETRELGGIPVLFTPFVREYLEGTPPTVTIEGQHNITAPYAGETTARGDYPAAAKAIAEKHDVPIVDITAWSKEMVDQRALQKTLDYLYIGSDQTHIRNLGALLMAQEAVRALNAQGIFTPYAKAPAPRVMLDSSTLAFGGLYTGSNVEKTFRITPFGDVTGTITVTAPSGYAVSTDGTNFATSTTLACDASYAGSIVHVRFAPVDPTAYNGDLTVAHTTLKPDHGNTVPNATTGVISLTGNGKVQVVGTPAAAMWPMFSGSAIVVVPTMSGGIGATPATLSGLVNKNVAYLAARFDTADGMWPVEAARNPARYIEFTVPVINGNFVVDTISADAGTGGGSAIRWDIVYSLTPDFASPTALGVGISGAKDTLIPSSYPSLGVSVTTGQTLYLRVYPYSSAAAVSGKSIMLANVVISGVVN